LEHLLKQRTLQVEEGKLTPKKAFGLIGDWIIQLGERKAFLHPNLKQWFWFDKLHEEWVPAGCRVDEAILLTLGNVGGIKKLPKVGSVANWCLYRKGEKPFGPIRIGELRKKLASKQVPEDILIWSTKATEWLKVEGTKGLD
jgi:hypothetical protein